jgi:hypothetical protein
MMVNKTVDFFLSHNRAEKEWAQNLNAALRSKGASTFFDEESVGFGEDIVAAITNALRASKHVVLILSPRSVKSRWVELEWSSAMYEDTDAQTRTIIPVLKDDCEIPFLLQRLRFIDARVSSIDEVANLLLSLISPNATQLSIKPSIKKTVWRGHALRFGAPQYVNRIEDARVDTVMRQGEAVLLYGPRMYGKTSMLFQMMAKEHLRGRSVIFLNCGGISLRDCTLMFEGIGRHIARELRCNWPENSSHPAISLSHLLLDYVAEQENGLALILDEFDYIGNSPGGAELGDWLRALLDNPAMRGTPCIAAGCRPPWMVKSQGHGSPWWDLFHIVRLGPFAPEQVTEFCVWLGGDTSDYAEDIWKLTGGHPALIAMIGHEYLRGTPIPKMLANPLDPALPLHEIAWMLHHLTDELLLKLRAGEPIPRKEREMLWLSGIINDVKANPPIVIGLLYRELIAQLANGL